MSDKKNTSFRLTLEALQLLKKIAEKEDRSETNVVERLIKEKADLLKLKLPK